MKQPSATLLYNIGDLVTCQPLAASKRGSKVTASDLGRLRHAWLFFLQGRVHSWGLGEPPKQLTAAHASNLRDVDAKQGLVMPGLCDAHTHPVFAGSRYLEFAQRLDGATYQEIAAQGGGILASVSASRAASDATLEALIHTRLQTFLRHGVTCVEVKSGYGLSVSEELRHLRLLKRIQAQAAQHLVVSCLALHAVPKNYPSASAYAQEISAELLPRLAAEGLADFVDAFIEPGYFTPSDCEPFFAQARALKLGIRIHADEFADGGGAMAAARWGAASADHLQYAHPAGLAAMAKAGVVATLLPGTSLYTGIPFTKAGPLRAAGCAIALASDFNPGSCLIDNLPLLASIAGVHCGLTGPEILAAVTYVPALSLGLGERKGALAAGFDADACLYPLSCAEEWLADMGRTAPRTVWIGGESVLST